MRDLAVFASSEEGKLYGATCARWGIDPGAIFDDDVLAYNLRLGLIGAMHEDETTDEAANHQALVDRALAAGVR